MCSCNLTHKHVTMWQDVDITQKNVEERGHDFNKFEQSF